MDPADIPADSMRLMLRVNHWTEIQKALDIMKSRGAIKPPKWVLINYFEAYRKFVDKTEEKHLESLSDRGYSAEGWAKALQISPDLDIWVLTEKRLYGEIVTPALKEYEERRERRR